MNNSVTVEYEEEHEEDEVANEQALNLIRHFLSHLPFGAGFCRYRRIDKGQGFNSIKFLWQDTDIIEIKVLNRRQYRYEIMINNVTVKDGKLPDSVRREFIEVYEMLVSNSKRILDEIIMSERIH